MERAVTCYALLHIVSIPIVLFAFFVCPSPAFSQGPVKIFLYAGQSNAEGVLASENSNLFPSSSFDEEIMYAWNLKGGNVTLNSGWNHLRKVPMGSRQITHAGEITAGRKIYGAGLTEVAFIKVTKGGTSLNRDWDPQSGNGMYAHMKEYIERKLRELDGRGIPYTIEAIFWHQGEGDTSPSFAAQYERNLQEFIDFLRRDYAPDIQVYLASIYNPERNPSDVAKVREAQMKAVANNKGVYFVNLDKVYYHSNGEINSTHVGRDGIHYRSAGYLKIGEAFGEAYLDQNPSTSCVGTIAPETIDQLSAQVVSPSDCGRSDAQIRFQGSTSGLEFSVNGGRDFQTSPVFNTLSAGRYNLAVRSASEAECQVEFPNNPLVISAPEIPSITEISSTSPSSCGGGDGAIQVEASGENLSYSLDGSSYQRISDFVSLAARAYTVYVRNTDAPSCITSIPVNVAFSVECDERECTGPVNLALNKPSVQSSTLGEGIASLANDGNTTGTDNWGTDANMQHTQDGLGGWWKVDLQEKVSLDGIDIYNRTTEQSSLLNRLRDFYVLSSSSDINTDRELEVLIRDPKVSSTFFSGAAGPVESIALGKTPGRFVMIALAGSGPLHMAEVEVYTCPAPAIIPEDSIDITVGMDPELSVKEDKVSWTLFPNPFIGESIIEILGDLKRVEYIQVVNVLGSEVEVISPPTSKRLTLGRKLPPGIYTVNLGYGKALLHKKVVKVQ